MADTQTLDRNPYLYHPVSRLLHWATVPLFIAVLVTGLDLDGMERGPEKSAAMWFHVSLGVTLATTLILRLVWRFVSKPPALPGFLDARRVFAAKASHILLYVLLFTQILLGDLAILTVTDLKVWGVTILETPFERDLDLHHFFEDLHKVVWWAVVGLLSIHIIAAISLFKKRDPETGHSAFRM